MIIYLMESMVGKDPRCFRNALVDFLIMGTQTGWRDVEWAQLLDPEKHSFYLYDKKSSQFTNLIYACCIEDFIFKCVNETTVANPTTMDADIATYCWV